MANLFIYSGQHNSIFTGSQGVILQCICMQELKSTQIQEKPCRAGWLTMLTSFHLLNKWIFNRNNIWDWVFDWQCRKSFAIQFFPVESNYIPKHHKDFKPVLPCLESHCGCGFVLMTKNVKTSISHYEWLEIMCNRKQKATFFWKYSAVCSKKFYAILIIKIDVVRIWKKPEKCQANFHLHFFISMFL